MKRDLGFEELNIMNGFFKHGDSVHLVSTWHKALEDLESITYPVSSLPSCNALRFS